MKKLPVFQITKDAYHFIFTDAKKILPMFVQYSTSIVLLYVFLHLIKDHFTFSPTGISRIFSSLAIFTFTTLALWLQLPLNISVVRTTAIQEKIGKDYFHLVLATRTRKAFLTMVITSLLFMMTLVGTAAIIGGLAFAFSPLNLQGISLNIFNIMLTMFGLIFILYVVLRLFLAIPNASLDNPQPIRLSWRGLKGQLIRLLVIVILTCLPSIVWSSFVSFLLNVSLDANPLAYGLLNLPQLYLGLILWAGLGLVYKHLNI
ncbi:hypothetical protein IM40_07175 [Candidatus Paracaedimonas acanthamoebae]|nr:hypothetical protein IM40_07175 [Candidatus Paracaedimonas acanthamoebae]